MGEAGKKAKGSSSERDKNNHAWMRFWQLRIPNKMKILLWR